MDRVAHRNFLGRKLGIIKKANMLHRKHDARIAVFVKKNNAIYCYQSDPNWPVVDNISVEPYNVFTPDHFDTVADRREARQSATVGAVYEVPETDLIRGTVGAVCAQEPGVDDACPSDVLAVREYSPGFLPMLDIELQSSIAHQVHPEQQQIAQGVTSLLSLWNSPNASSSTSLDTPGALGSSNSLLPPASKKARHVTPDADRNHTKS
ncbi:hypothetical protein CHU98_g2322 [Xylaria longipes]|nr:hypothetical protein CHU98_g2322 [Xylaria longipes]